MGGGAGVWFSWEAAAKLSAEAAGISNLIPEEGWACLQEASVPCRLLAKGLNPCPVHHFMVCSQHGSWFLPEQKSKERARLQGSNQKGSHIVLNNIFLKSDIPLHLSTNSYKIWKEPYKGKNIKWQELLMATLGAAYHSC